jgi:AraC-like DNA-binding protein
MPFQPIILKPEFDVEAVINISYYRLSRDYAFPGEEHSCWEFLYVDRGSVVVTAGADTYFMKAGELAFHCPNEFHAFRAVGEADIVVVSFVCDSPSMHRLEKKVLLLHTKEKEHLKMLINESQQVYRYFDNIAPRINMEKKPDAPWGSDQLIKTYLEQLFIHICRRDDNVKFAQRAVSSRSPSHGPVLAQRIKDYLHDHYTRKITLESLAQEMGVSASQIKRTFREQIGQSMVNYITQLRISQAKRLIREGDLNFTQIADAVGYDSIYYFSSLFKKYTGKTLSEYSRSLKD